jgi:hypothetical protein
LLARFESFALFSVDDNQPVELKSNDQGILSISQTVCDYKLKINGFDETIYLASEKNVGFADDFVVQNQQQSKDEKRGILQNDIDEDGPNVDGTTDVFGRVATVVFLFFHPDFGFLGFSRTGRQDHGKLKQTPRPNG